jgi:hypothetical protein
MAPFTDEAGATDFYAATVQQVKLGVATVFFDECVTHLVVLRF